MNDPYSDAITDDVDACGVEPSGIRNHILRYLVAQRCRAGDRVIDICCGRGRQLSTLRRYRPDLHSYTGLDSRPTRLADACERFAAGSIAQPPFPVTFRLCDLASPWPVAGPFDVAVYTSVFEHLPHEVALANLAQAAASLTPGGLLLLSVPMTAGQPQRGAEHGELDRGWLRGKIRPALDEVGLVVVEVVGIRPAPTVALTESALRARFGDDAADLYRAMRNNAPEALVGPVVATVIGDAAADVLYVCRRRLPRHR